jgi:hypothetical protein
MIMNHIKPKKRSLLPFISLIFVILLPILALSIIGFQKTIFLLLLLIIGPIAGLIFGFIGFRTSNTPLGKTISIISIVLSIIILGIIVMAVFWMLVIPFIILVIVLGILLMLLKGVIRIVTSAFFIILCIAVIIGAIWYFGLLSPQHDIFTQCNIDAGFTCNENLISSSNNLVELELKNTIGIGILVTNITAVPAANNPIAEQRMYIANGAKNSETGVQYLAKDEVYNFILSCPTNDIKPEFIDRGRRFTWDLVINYYTEGSTKASMKKVNGQLIAVVYK